MVKRASKVRVVGELVVLLLLQLYVILCARSHPGPSCKMRAISVAKRHNTESPFLTRLVQCAASVRPRGRDRRSTSTTHSSVLLVSSYYYALYVHRCFSSASFQRRYKPRLPENRKVVIVENVPATLVVHHIVGAQHSTSSTTIVQELMRGRERTTSAQNVSVNISTVVYGLAHAPQELQSTHGGRTASFCTYS